MVYVAENQVEDCWINDALCREYKSGSTEATTYFNLERKGCFSSWKNPTSVHLKGTEAQ